MKFIKLFTTCVIIIGLAFTGCKSKLDQKSMFQGRSHKSKKGVYNTGLNSKKPISVQIAKDLDKQSKYDANPKKAAKKEAKALEKKKREAQKKRDKYNKKRRVKVKTTKGKSDGDK